MSEGSNQGASLQYHDYYYHGSFPAGTYGHSARARHGELVRGELQASEASEVSEPQRAGRSEVVVRMQEQRCSGHRRAQRAQQVTGERSELRGEAVSGASSADEAREASQAGEANGSNGSGE